MSPEMSPNLDDAIVALDRSGSDGHLERSSFDTLRAFLEQLHCVRDVSAVTLTPEEAARMEGAYQFGVRAADESGHVLVVSLPAFLELTKPAQRGAWADPIGRMFERLGALASHSRAAEALIAVSWGCFVFEHLGAALAFFVVALLVAAVARAAHEADQWRNRARMAESALDSLTDSHARWKRRAQAAEGRISTAQVEQLFKHGVRGAG